MTARHPQKTTGAGNYRTLGHCTCGHTEAYHLLGTGRNKHTRMRCSAWIGKACGCARYVAAEPKEAA